MRPSIAIAGLALASSTQASLLQCNFPAKYQPFDSAIKGMWETIKSSVSPQLLSNVALQSSFLGKRDEDSGHIDKRQAAADLTPIGSPCSAELARHAQGMDLGCLSNGMQMSAMKPQINER
jgi:hypothetical protein